MEIIARHGREELALLSIGRLNDGSLVEFVESIQPPVPREEKWVLIVSTLKGCPVDCLMCDAGGDYRGRLSASEILEQIDMLVTARYPDRIVPVPKFKVQFARMGEPTLNDAVLDVLKELPHRYNAPGLMPCLSTVLPQKCDRFFNELTEIKNRLYSGGSFQMQFSLHTTDLDMRRRLINYPVLSFKEAASLGERFHQQGDRKIALNFAIAKGCSVDAKRLRQLFDPAIFLIKLTPLNPTEKAHANGLESQIDTFTGEGSEEITADLQDAGYRVILSLGEPEEDTIGSNCGQYVNRYKNQREAMRA